MIFLTGDCHGNFQRFSTALFPEQKHLTKADVCIILGDFGGVWDYAGESRQERYWLDWLEQKPYTTLFLDGNHECHERLKSYPVRTYAGGRVHEIRRTVLHLMRGETYTIDGKTLFVFGGAASHDVRDGILDPEKDREKIRRWTKDSLYASTPKQFRVEGRSWWKEELPSPEEMENGRRRLEACRWHVDYVLSHCAPQSVVDALGMEGYPPDCLTQYFDELLEHGLSYRKWYFGHYHERGEGVQTRNCIGLYRQILNLQEAWEKK